MHFVYSKLIELSDSNIRHSTFVIHRSFTRALPLAKKTASLIVKETSKSKFWILECGFWI
ncbi:hypothetical protein D1AOALGA4SA_8645 [Olavius algarvensis Delta 1 endosymbiont]|nr:hypothetical protein D1AOALGA4SA_8645 [Olavius algarvensis Delta 1 endosymbiont]